MNSFTFPNLLWYLFWSAMIVGNWSLIFSTIRNSWNFMESNWCWLDGALPNISQSVSGKGGCLKPIYLLPRWPHHRTTYFKEYHCYVITLRNTIPNHTFWFIQSRLVIWGFKLGLMSIFWVSGFTYNVTVTSLSHHDVVLNENSFTLNVEFI